MKKKCHTDNLTQKYLLYKFVAWNCNRCSTTPLNDYINNPVFQELIDEEDYYTEGSDKKLYLDLRANSGYTNKAVKLESNNSKINLHLLLISAATKNLRVMVWAHSIIT